jgi:acetylornithine/N-succinyldiaminopimelate aminotransferase
MTGSALYETFARAPLSFERGEGAWLIEASGERYLDLAGGIAVNSLGHCHPHLVAALTEQANKVWHVSNLYQIPDQSRLAERLAEATFADKVFFTNSGAEALECAIKTARRYHFVNGHPERYRTITFEGAFHGRTLATIAAGASTNISKVSGRRSTASIRWPSTTSMLRRKRSRRRPRRSSWNLCRARAASAPSRRNR